MKPSPKPIKLKDEKKHNHDLAKAFRRANVILAIQRDNGLCTICWYIHHRIRQSAEVHHVYSRESRFSGSFREHYHNLLCTCRDCHPQPIIIPGGSSTLSWIEDVRDRANIEPINKNFVHKDVFSGT